MPYGYIFAVFLTFMFFQLKVYGRFHLGYFMLFMITFWAFLHFLKDTVYYRAIRIPSDLIPVILFFGVMLFSTVLAYTVYGYDLSAVRYFIMVFSFFAGFFLFRYTFYDYAELIKKATFLFFVLFYLRNLFYIKDITNLPVPLRQTGGR